MKSSIMVAAGLGYVVGYNCYLHVWPSDLVMSSVVGGLFAAGFLLWFGKQRRIRLQREKATYS